MVDESMPITPEDSDREAKIESQQFHLQDNDIQIEKFNSESDKIESVKQEDETDLDNDFKDNDEPVKEPSGYSQSIKDDEDDLEENEKMVDDIMKWIELRKNFNPLFQERRFDIKMVDKSTQHSTLCKHLKVEALKLMLAPKSKQPKQETLSAKDKLKSNMLLNTTTADE